MTFFVAQNRHNRVFINLTQIRVELWNNTTTNITTSFSCSITAYHVRNNSVIATKTLTNMNWQGISGNSNKATNNTINWKFNILTDKFRARIATTNPFTLREFHVFFDCNNDVDQNILTKDYGSNTVDTYSETLEASISPTVYNKNKNINNLTIGLYTGTL